jgi:quinolinate synthase
MEAMTCVDQIAIPSPGEQDVDRCPGARATLTLPAVDGGRRPYQPPLPADYPLLSPAELGLRLARARALLGPRAVILGHHYQRDDIVKFADFRGDSLKLSQQAATRREAEFIVFCGVHFMAESADILSAAEQQVILPNLEAGCSMADMADLDAVGECWQAVTRLCGPSVVPVTYINSTAAVKAFCGAQGGAVCTSSNAPAVLRWALARSERVLCLPDEHLGRNTARQLGLDPAAVALWNPAEPLGGNSATELRRARLIVWKGFCSVHMRFSVEQIARTRERYPGVKVIVHPECRSEVVLAADAAGSTEFIAKAIAEAPAGSRWAVGTEINLVSRLAREHPDKLVFSLDPVVCPCSTMYRIHPAYLLWTLEELLAGRVVNRITVPAEVAQWARLALDRMLAIA